MKLRIGIVEDEKNYSNTLKKVIDNESDMYCSIQFFNGKDALAQIDNHFIDVFLMDIQLPDMSGIDLVKKFSRKYPETKFIMCTTFEDEGLIYEALKAGACGYLLKDESLVKIISAIRDAANGSAPMSNNIAQKVLKYFQAKQNITSQLDDLSTREIEILQLLSEGKLYKEIADVKCISIETVKKHIGNIYKKLHVANKIEAVNKFNGKN
jgi:two-component system, NarL family, response regulator LiaR